MRNCVRILLLLVLGASLALAGGVFAKRPASSTIQGTHKLKIVGDLNGVGKAVVSDRDIRFSLDLTDDKGGGCKMESDEIDFGDGRFSGTCQISGQNATVSGRVDLPVGGKFPRVTGMIRFADGRVARIANSFKIAGATSSGDGDDDDHDPPSTTHDDEHAPKAKPLLPPNGGIRPTPRPPH